MLESQATYIADALRVMRDERGRDRRGHRGRAAALQRRAGSAAGAHRLERGGCDSWYLDASGRNSVMWPTYTWRFRRRTRRFDRENYRLTTAGEDRRATEDTGARA